MIRGLHIDPVRDYRPGDPEPEGYLEWHEWARVQVRAGIHQRNCRVCGLWQFPQALDPTRLVSDEVVCLGCAARKP